MDFKEKRGAALQLLIDAENIIEEMLLETKGDLWTKSAHDHTENILRTSKLARSLMRYMPTEPDNIFEVEREKREKEKRDAKYSSMSVFMKDATDSLKEARPKIEKMTRLAFDDQWSDYDHSKCVDADVNVKNAIKMLQTVCLEEREEDECNED